MYELFRQGGIVMYPLLFLSICTLALWAHRYLLLAKFNKSENLMSAPIEHIQRGIDSLFLICSISPLLGLLGTVFGVIRSFSTLSLGRPDAQILSLGLSEALITTAAGLIISIPAQVAGHFLQQKLDKLVKKYKIKLESI